MITTRLLLIVFLFFIFVMLTGTSYAKDTARIIFSSKTPIATAGQVMTVTVLIDSSVPVNAVQAKIIYPENKFKLLSVNYANSQFSIKAQETITPGNITMARGNIQPKSGKNELAVITFDTLSNGNISDFTYSPENSLAMSSSKNENILVGSEVETVKPPVPTKVNIISKLFQPEKTSSKTPNSFWEFLWQGTKTSIQKIFNN